MIFKELIGRVNIEREKESKMIENGIKKEKKVFKNDWKYLLKKNKSKDFKNPFVKFV